MTTLSQKDYLKNEHVKGFIEYLAGLIDGGENSFEHSYLNKQSKQEWQCNSLQDAFQQYYWDGKNYSETKEELNKYKKELKESFTKFEQDKNDPANEIKFMKVCKDILDWGGVLSHNTEWMVNKICSKEGLIKAFSDAKNILSETDEFQIDTAEWNKTGQTNTCKFRMNAGYTKIYSLLCNDFIIYDSRVAAALGKIIINYMNEKHIKEKEIPDELKIGVMAAKGKQNRNPSQGKKKFQNLGNNGTKHTEWNVKANWILAKAVDKANIKWGGKNKQEKLRALEAALFMIGYDIPLEKSASIKSKKIIITKKHKAIQLYNKHSKSKSRAQIIKLLIKEVGLTQAGANTYYQNCKTTWI